MMSHDSIALEVRVTLADQLHFTERTLDRPALKKDLSAAQLDTLNGLVTMHTGAPKGSTMSQGTPISAE